MTDSSPPPHTSKHQLDEPAGPPSAKKLKTGTLDSFLIKPKSNSSPKSSPAKASLKATDTNVGEKTPGETVTTTHTVSTETSTELGAAEPAEGAVAETIEETTTNKDKPTLQTTLDLTSVQPSAPAKSTASSEGFDPEAWLESLATAASGPSTRDLLALEARTMDSSWLALVKGELTKSYFLGLKRFLWTQGVQGEDSKVGKVFPPAKDIYAWSRYTPLTKVRVVIIGQDPYHGPGQAHGLCFSVRPGVAVPPSLRNIYKEIGNENPGFVAPKHGNLISWAQHGVLLLNTSLTVEAAKAGSHAGKGWETLTDKLIALVDKYGGSGEVGKEGEGVVFLAWGAWAGKRVERLDKTKHLVLKSAHPSPLSASRGFLGNNHFKQCNEWLEKKYGPESKIPWTEVDVNAA